MTMIYLDMVFHDSETHTVYCTTIQIYQTSTMIDIQTFFDIKIHQLIQNLVCNTLNASAVKLDYHFNLWSFAKRIT